MPVFLLLYCFVFNQFDKTFEPYAEYCLKQEACHEYIKLKMTENEQFRTFITVSAVCQFFWQFFFASLAFQLRTASH